MMRRWGAVLVLVLLVAACGSSSDGGSEATTTTSLPPCPEEPTVDPHSMGGHEGDDHEDHAAAAEPSRDCRLPAEVQAELDPQLAVTRSLLEEYPDADAARGGGFELSEGNSHLVNWSRMDGEFDVAEPEMLLLDDEGNTDQVVAAVYYVVGSEDAPPPDGFVGTRDLWHFHADVCVVPARTVDGTQVACDEDASARCEIPLLRSGQDGACGPATLADGTASADGWMLHVWEAPGHPSPLGLFSAD